MDGCLNRAKGRMAHWTKVFAERLGVRVTVEVLAAESERRYRVEEARGTAVAVESVLHSAGPTIVFTNRDLESPEVVRLAHT
jgi:hypothetical protein